MGDMLSAVEEQKWGRNTMIHDGHHQWLLGSPNPPEQQQGVQQTSQPVPQEAPTLHREHSWSSDATATVVNTHNEPVSAVDSETSCGTQQTLYVVWFIRLCSTSLTR